MKARGARALGVRRCWLASPARRAGADARGRPKVRRVRWRRATCQFPPYEMRTLTTACRSWRCCITSSRSSACA